MNVDVVEASISTLRWWLETAQVTSQELVAAYYARMDAYDCAGINLNSVVVRNPKAFEQAYASDLRRQQKRTLSALDGIPYTAKDSYLAKGLIVAAGSPAFATLRAQKNAFAIDRLESVGAVLLGLTNMPPMANGGMQRGLYGRAESPYNETYLTSAFASGSSNGSGTATAASFAAFGLAEETWSSGRAPASYNGLCAYTPSRGLLSMRGNWSLVPTMDVLVPHTRSVEDLLEMLDVLVVADPYTRGDFWRSQPWVRIPPVGQLRPVSYRGMMNGASVEGKRLGVVRMYINADDEAGTNPSGGIGGSTGKPIQTRESIVQLWQHLRQILVSRGAHVQGVDFPLVSQYEADRPGATNLVTGGFVSREYLKVELLDLSAWAWEDFLQANGDPAFDTLVNVDPETLFPHPPRALPDRYDGFDDDIGLYPSWVAQHPHASLSQMEMLAGGVCGLERMRKHLLEEWMDELGLDAIVFPAVADVGGADMDTNPCSAEHGWKNGVWVANGNLAIRHAGVPTVTIPLGMMDDTHMPVGLTILGRSGDDAQLLQLAYAIEQAYPIRVAPPRTPACSGAPV